MILPLRSVLHPRKVRSRWRRGLAVGESGGLRGESGLDAGFSRRFKRAAKAASGVSERPEFRTAGQPSVSVGNP